MKYLFNILIFIYLVLPVIILTLVFPANKWPEFTFEFKKWLTDFLAKKPFSYIPLGGIFGGTSNQSYSEVSFPENEYPNGIDKAFLTANKNVFNPSYSLQVPQGIWYEMRVNSEIAAKFPSESSLANVGINSAIFKGLNTSCWESENEVRIFEYSGRAIGNLQMLTDILIEGRPGNETAASSGFSGDAEMRTYKEWKMHYQKIENRQAGLQSAVESNENSNGGVIKESAAEQKFEPFTVGRVEVLGGEFQMLKVLNEEMRSFSSVSHWEDLAELWCEAESSDLAVYINQIYGPRLESLQQRFPNARVQLNKDNENSSAPVQTNFSESSEFTYVTHGVIFGDLIVDLLEGESFDESKLVITFQDLVFAPQHGIDYESVVIMVEYEGRVCEIDWTDRGQARFVTAVAADSNAEVVTLYDSRIMDSPSWESIGLSSEVDLPIADQESALFFVQVNLEDEMHPFLGSELCPEAAAEIIVENAADLCEAISARVQDDALCYLVTFDGASGKKFLRLNPEQANGSVSASRRRELKAALHKVEFSNFSADENTGSLMLAFETDYSSLWDYAFLKVSNMINATTVTFYGWHEGHDDFGAQSYHNGEFDEEGIESDGADFYIGDAPNSALSQVGITASDFKRAKSNWEIYGS